MCSLPRHRCLCMPCVQGMITDTAAVGHTCSHRTYLRTKLEQPPADADSAVLSMQGAGVMQQKVRMNQIRHAMNR